jgi:hypothetical protein
MRRRGFLAVATLMAGLAGPMEALAETPIRSGEHPTFTRLVFPAEAGLAWTRGAPRDREVEFVFADPALRLSAADVFERIPRTRLKAMAVGDATLLLHLACDCPIDIRQIGSGHIVIDVRDPDEPATPAEDPAPTAAVALPLALPPLMLPGLGRVEERPAPPPDRPAQIAVSSAPRQGPPQDVAPPIRRGCELEPLIAEVLRTDPKPALLSALASFGTLTDAADGLDAEAVRRMGRRYLEAGFGAEADATFARAGLDSDDPLRRLARLLDGDGPRGEGDLQPACGPASATLALATGAAPGGDIDEPALIAFIDGLPAGRRAAIARGVDRAVVASDPLGAYLMTQTGPPEIVPPTPSAAAGTDRDAVAASTALLEAGAPDVVILENALALRRSIPGGPLAEAHDRALLRSLIETKHLAAAALLLEERPTLADEALAHALDHLAAPDAVEAAMRFSRDLGRDGPHHARAAALLRSYGLSAAARRFDGGDAGPSSPPLPEQAAAWLGRDLTLVAREEDGASRSSVARQILARNEVPLPEDDFARAQAVADRGKTLLAVLGSLVDEATEGLPNPPERPGDES